MAVRTWQGHITLALLLLVTQLSVSLCQDLQAQPISLRQLDTAMRLSICNTMDNDCVSSFNWRINVSGSATPTGQPCIGAAGSGCTWPNITAFLAVRPNTVLYKPSSLELVLPSLDQAFQMGHNFLGGYFMQQLLSLTVSCTSPLTVYAPLVLDPIISALGAVTNTTILTPSVQSLSIRSCKLTGNLPKSISRLTNLRTLDLSGNALDGMLPSSLSSTSSYLTNVNLSSNAFFGSPPDGLQLLGACGAKLDLSRNDLSGKLPKAWLASACTMRNKQRTGVSASSDHAAGVASGSCDVDGISWDRPGRKVVLTGTGGSDGQAFPFSIFLTGNGRLQVPTSTGYATAQHPLLFFAIRENVCTYYDPWAWLIAFWSAWGGAIGGLMIMGAFMACIRAVRAANADTQSLTHYWATRTDSWRRRLSAASVARTAGLSTRLRAMRMRMSSIVGPIRHRDCIVRMGDCFGAVLHGLKAFTIAPFLVVPWALLFRLGALVALYGGTGLACYILLSKQRREYCETLVDCYPLLYLVPPGLALLPLGLVLYVLYGLRRLATNMGQQVQRMASAASIKPNQVSPAWWGPQDDDTTVAACTATMTDITTSVAPGRQATDRHATDRLDEAVSESVAWAQRSLSGVAMSSPSKGNVSNCAVHSGSPYTTTSSGAAEPMAGCILAATSPPAATAVAATAAALPASLPYRRQHSGLSAGPLAEALEVLPLSGDVSAAHPLHRDSFHKVVSLHSQHARNLFTPCSPSVKKAALVPSHPPLLPTNPSLSVRVRSRKEQACSRQAATCVEQALAKPSVIMALVQASMSVSTARPAHLFGQSPAALTELAAQLLELMWQRHEEREHALGHALVAKGCNHTSNSLSFFDWAHFHGVAGQNGDDMAQWQRPAARGAMAGKGKDNHKTQLSEAVSSGLISIALTPTIAARAAAPLLAATPRQAGRSQLQTFARAAELIQVPSASPCITLGSPGFRRRNAFGKGPLGGVVGGGGGVCAPGDATPTSHACAGTPQQVQMVHMSAPHSGMEEVDVYSSPGLVHYSTRVGSTPGPLGEAREVAPLSANQAMLTPSLVSPMGMVVVQATPPGAIEEGPHAGSASDGSHLTAQQPSGAPPPTMPSQQQQAQQQLPEGVASVAHALALDSEALGALVAAGQDTPPPGMQAVLIQGPEGPEVQYVALAPGLLITRPPSMQRLPSRTASCPGAGGMDRSTLLTAGGPPSDHDDDENLDELAVPVAAPGALPTHEAAAAARAVAIDPMACEVVRQYITVLLLGPAGADCCSRLQAVLLALGGSVLCGLLGLILVPAFALLMLPYLLLTVCMRSHLPRLYALLYTKLFAGLALYWASLGHGILLAGVITAMYALAWNWGQGSVPWPELWLAALAGSSASCVVLAWDVFVVQKAAWRNHVLMFPYRYAMLKRAHLRAPMSGRRLVVASSPNSIVPM